MKLLLGAVLLLCACCSRDQARQESRSADERPLAEIVKSASLRHVYCDCSNVFVDPDCKALVAYLAASPHRDPPCIAGVCDQPLKCPPPESFP